MCYTYDNLSRVTTSTVKKLSDNSVVTYTYDANHNLVRVTDWANRVTSYAYDVNNRVVSVTKPDGSVTTTLYDNKQRVTFTTKLLPMSSALSKIQGDCTCNRLFIILHVIFTPLCNLL